MKVGILGGTFNPIHNSHLYLGQAYREALGLARVLLVPACTPPHKEADHLVSAEDRLRMCELAAQSLFGFGVCGYEVEQAGKSYTYRTLEYLNEENPHWELFLLMGTDMFLTLQDWREPGRIIARATLCAAAREPGELALLQAHRPLLEEMGARCVILRIPPKPLSSTQIRRALARGEPVGQWLPPAVWDYIQEKGLYQRPGGRNH